MTIMDTQAAEAPTSSDGTAADDGFDLDIRIAVAKDVQLPEAGFTCSWYTCSRCCTYTTNIDRCC